MANSAATADSSALVEVEEDAPGASEPLAAANWSLRPKPALHHPPPPPMLTVFPPPPPSPPSPPQPRAGEAGEGNGKQNERDFGVEVGGLHSCQNIDVCPLEIRQFSFCPGV